MLQKIVVAALLIALGLFATSGIASSDSVSVYSAADHSALAPPGIAIANADRQILKIIDRQFSAASPGIHTGTIASVSDKPRREPRQDFL